MNLKLFFLMILSISNYLIGGGFEVGSHTDIGSKHTNEDRCVVTSRCLAVFDGSAGIYLSEFMKTETEEILKKDDPWSGLKTICDKGQKHAEQLVGIDFEDHATNYNKKFFLTTAAIAYINEQKKLHICWVGDSRIVVVNKRDDIVYETKDHKPNRPDEEQRLIALQKELQEQNRWEEGELPIYSPADPRKNTIARTRNSAISRAIGCVMWAQEKSVINEPEFYEKDLDENDDFIINACDGLWDVFKSQEAVHFVRGKLNAKMALNDICKALVNEALKKGSRDNVTVTLMLLNNLSPKKENYKKVLHLPHRSWNARELVNRYTLGLGIVILSWICYQLYYQK